MIYDITPPITSDLKVWPGDTPPTREVLLDMADGANLTLSTLHATVHLGAHADAPNHYGTAAPSIDGRSLDYYIGPCQVITVNAAPGTRIEMKQLGAWMDAAVGADIDAEIFPERILLHTDTFPHPTVFNEDFAALSPLLVDELAKKGTKLIGIDTPSVDLFDSKDLPAHQSFLRNDMAILEGLVLTGVPDGMYELIALPLKPVGFDASPVRAILRPLN